MKQLLLNCDQVFDVLTRGPFPTGAASDESVEQHLRACHECRQLAEALRPAVALLHEAIAGDQALDLPGYQGSLPPAAVIPGTTGRNRRSQRKRWMRWPSTEQIVNIARAAAASILVAAIGTLLYNLSMSAPAGSLAKVRGGFTSLPALTGARRAPQPDAEGLLTLASFQLPAHCLPLSHRPLTPEKAAEIAAAIAEGSLDALRCCSECHHGGLNQQPSSRLVAVLQQNCQLCHRG